MNNGSSHDRKRMVFAWALLLGSIGLILASVAPNFVGIGPSDTSDDYAEDSHPTRWSLEEPAESDWLDSQAAKVGATAAPKDSGPHAVAASPPPKPSEDRRAGPPASEFDLQSFDCLIEPRQLIEVGSSVTGVIEAVHVDRSDFVEAGQVLAEIESKVEQAAVELARMRADMKGDVAAHEASARLSESREARAQRLFAADTLSTESREELEAEAELSHFSLLRAKEQKQLAAAELEQALEVLERRKIRSPITGVVVERLKLPGEVVKEEKVITVAEIDPLYAEVVLPAALFGSLQPGMRAQVTPELDSAGVRVATIDVVDRVIDAASGTFRVRLELPNPDHALPSGLHCQARFLPGTAPALASK